MARKFATIIPRRGQEVNIDTAIAANGELALTTDSRRIYVGDEFGSFQPTAGVMDVKVNNASVVDSDQVANLTLGEMATKDEVAQSDLDATLNTKINSFGEGTVMSVGAGSGMNFTAITNTGAVAMGTPSSITDTSTNSVTAGTHAHELANGAVTNNKMAQVPQYTVKGKHTAGTGEPLDITMPQLADIISKATITAKSAPVNGDSFIFTDSQASNVAKRVSVSQLKTVFKDNPQVHFGATAPSPRVDQLLWIKPTNNEIMVVGQIGAMAATVGMPAHQAGDIILVSVLGGTTPATIPAGYTEIGNGNVVIGSPMKVTVRTGYKIAATNTETVGTWTNANYIVVAVFRAANGKGTFIGTTAEYNQIASDYKITYPGIVRQKQTSAIILIGGANGWGDIGPTNAYASMIINTANTNENHSNLGILTLVISPTNPLSFPGTLQVFDPDAYGLNFSSRSFSIEVGSVEEVPPELYMWDNYRWVLVSGASAEIEITAGNGMNFATITESGAITLGTPSNITSTSTNTVSGTTHSHHLADSSITTAKVNNGAITMAKLAPMSGPSVIGNINSGQSTPFAAPLEEVWLSMGRNTSAVTNYGIYDHVILVNNNNEVTSKIYAGDLIKVREITAGNGLNFTTITSTGAITLGTPSNITSTSTSSVTATSHSHHLSDNAITTPKINDNAVTLAKIATIATNTVLGNNQSSATNPQALTMQNFGDIFYAGTITSKTTPVNADFLYIGDSANSNVVRQVSLTNFKTFINSGVGTITSITAGNGLNFTTITSGAATVTLGTPSSITGSSTNSVTSTSHTHELANDSVSTFKIVDNNVTLPKLATLAAYSIIGNPVSFTANPVSISMPSFGNMLYNATIAAKTTPIDTDFIYIGDSSTSNNIKQTTFAQLKSVLGGATTATYTATIPVAGTWTTGSSARAGLFYKSVTGITGLLATDTPIIDIVQTGTETTDIIMRADWANVTQITTAANSVTVYTKVVPTGNMPIQLKVIR